MRIVALRETGEHETRAAITPESVRKLLAIGPGPGASSGRAANSANSSDTGDAADRGGDPPVHAVAVETGIGTAIGAADDEYADAGAEIEADRGRLLEGADLLLHVDPPESDEIPALRPGTVVAGFLGVWDDPRGIERLAAAGVSALSLELMPRTTRAQSMDAISSQHSLAGYAMAILAAQRLGQVFPMMVTPSGTLRPARVLVVGAGVAGLQAIATAHRLGARVEAFDTRPATKEQVESLGARFIQIELGDTGEAAGGYARELTDDQKRRQQDALAGSIAKADVVITTAAVPGRRAPVIVTREMAHTMRPGSVIVDYAASRGGNVDGTRPGQEFIDERGVRYVGLMNYAALVAADASRMLASNLHALAKHVCGGAGEKPEIAALRDAGDDIVTACLVAHAGEITNDDVRRRLAESDQPRDDGSNTGDPA